MKSLNILSLFDGMSCGQIALNELSYPINIYYASEIDKHAISQTQLNFPSTVQIGSVVNIDVKKLNHIDLLIGGSHCQSLSFAGKKKGMSTKCEREILDLETYLKLKKEGFEFEGQSYLFWEYMRILTDIRKYNPNILFVLENVEMSKKWERVLSEAIGVFGVHINSSLVSAQSRARIYWTNIRTRAEGFFGELHSDIPQPEDKGILLKDIMQPEVDEKYYLSDKALKGIEEHKKRNKENGNGFGAKIMRENEKSNAIKIGGKGKDNLIITHNLQPRQGKGVGGKGHLQKEDGKSYCLELTNTRIRRLTPTECSRLQTIPDWYNWECSDTQCYKMLGNGWTIEVIKHIFSFINFDNQ